MAAFTKIAFLVLAILTVAAYGLAYMNRASDKIVSAIVPIGLAAVLGVGTAVLVFGGEPKARSVFPTSFLIIKHTQLPWFLETQSLRLSLVKDTLKRIPMATLQQELAADPWHFYHHLLQRAIVNRLVTVYTGAWQFETRRYNLPVGEIEFPVNVKLPGKKEVGLDVKHINAAMTGNILQIAPIPDEARISTPEQTVLAIDLPGHGSNSTGAIHLNNPLIKLSIKTEALIKPGSLGNYAKALDLAGNDFELLVFNIEVETEFTRWYAGHPDMAPQKAWAAQIAEDLRNCLDDERDWQRITTQLQLGATVKALAAGN